MRTGFNCIFAVERPWRSRRIGRKCSCRSRGGSGCSGAMDAFFVDLGRRVRKQWQAVDFSLAAFPGIAQTALEENPPATQVDLTDLTRSFLRDDEQPFQTASGFGQPELVVYDDPRF
jgi:hypothetical protein